MKDLDGRLVKREMTDEELDAECDRLSAEGRTAFDFEASEVGYELVEWFDEELQKLGYELEQLDNDPVKWYKVTKKEAA